MSIGPSSGAASELDVLRREYESSLSWRVTRPLRALRRAGRRVPAEAPAIRRPGATTPGWAIERLSRIDAACAEGAGLALFRELETDLWALLLTQEYTRHPHIRALLPACPTRGSRSLERRPWRSAGRAEHGVLRRLRATPVGRPLDEARVLDFGCGWGRLHALPRP